MEAQKTETIIHTVRFKLVWAVFTAWLQGYKLKITSENTTVNFTNDL